MIPGQGHCLSGVYRFSSCLCGFSWRTLVPPTSPKMCMWDELVYLNCHSPIKGGCGCALPRKGVLSWVGAHLVLQAAGRSFNHPWPWIGIRDLENNYLLIITISLMYIQVKFISVFTIRSILDLYLEVLWPEICHRNITLVYINYPIVKWVSLYFILLKIIVSKNLGTAFWIYSTIVIIS